MPLFLRSNASKRNLAQPSPPPVSAVSDAPPLLPLPSFVSSASAAFLPSSESTPTSTSRPESSSSSSTSTIPTTSSLASSSSVSTLPSSTSSAVADVDTRWSVLDSSSATLPSAPNGGVASPRKGGGGSGSRSRKSSVGSSASKGEKGGLKGLFGRRRSGSKSREAAREEEGVAEGEKENEVVPPVPALPASLLLAGAIDSPYSSSGVATPSTTHEEPHRQQQQPVQPQGEEDELASLLYLVHAAGDKFASSDSGDVSASYEPRREDGQEKDEFRTPPLISCATFSSSPSPASTLSSAAPETPNPVYSFLSHLSPSSSQSSKPAPLPASSSSFNLSSSPSFLRPPPTHHPSSRPLPHSRSTPRLRRPPPVSVDDGKEDDYGAASSGDEEGGKSGWKSKPTSAFARPGPRSRPRPNAAATAIGPRAASVLLHSLDQLTPSSSPSSSQFGPRSTYPPTSSPTSPLDLRKKLAHLSLACRLSPSSSLSPSEAAELDPSSSFPSPSSSAAALDEEQGKKRASVFSVSMLRLSTASSLDSFSVLSPASASSPASTGEKARKAVDAFERDHGKLGAAETRRTVLDHLPPSSAVAGGRALFSAERLRTWAQRPAFEARKVELRVIEVGGTEVLREDVVRPARLRSAGLEAGRSEGMFAILTEVGRRERGSGRKGAGWRGEGEGLLNPVFRLDPKDITLPAALKAAAAGAASPPPPSAARMAARSSLLPPQRVGGGGGGKAGNGGRKPLLPGPLLLKVLAEEGTDLEVPDGRIEKGESGGRGGKDEEEDEDDRPLLQLKHQRQSLLPPPRPSSTLPPPFHSPTSPLTKRSSALPPSSSSAALAHATRRADLLSLEVSRLRQAQLESQRREEDLRREHEEKEEKREAEEREKRERRRREEQQRRSRIMHAPKAATGVRGQGGEEGERRKKDARRGSTLPPSASSSTPHLLPVPGAVPPPQPWLGAAPAAYIPVPMPVQMVPMPFYQAPYFSSSAPDLHQQQQLLQSHLLQPQPHPQRAVSRSGSRQSLLPPFPPPTRAPSPHPHSHPPPTPKRSSHLPLPHPPSRSQPTTPKRQSSHPALPRSSSSSSPFASSSTSSHKPGLPHSHSAPLPTTEEKEKGKRVSVLPPLFLSPSSHPSSTSTSPTGTRQPSLHAHRGSPSPLRQEHASQKEKKGERRLTAQRGGDAFLMAR
ncbi:hypothetical protein JCM8547_007510 [Rhodosporidiobolus lusitaniae]